MLFVTFSCLTHNFVSPSSYQDKYRLCACMVYTGLHFLKYFCYFIFINIYLRLYHLLNIIHVETIPQWKIFHSNLIYSFALSAKSTISSLTPCLSAACGNSISINVFLCSLFSIFFSLQTLFLICFHVTFHYTAIYVNCIAQLMATFTNETHMPSHMFLMFLYFIPS